MIITIEEAIQHCKEVAAGKTVQGTCPECAAEHKQLAEWLEELVRYGMSGVDLLYKVKITTFSTVDEVHASHLPVLDLRAMLVMGAFGAGFVRVKDRAPKVRSLEADTSFFDCAVVTLTLALTLDRADFVRPELHELMEKLEMQVRAKEK